MPFDQLIHRAAQQPVPYRPSPTLIERCRAIPASVLSDVFGGRNTLHGGIAPLAPSMRMAGPALTVEVLPGDNLMVHAALALAKPGDVLVVDGKGDLRSALVGSIMTTTAIARGLAGIVVDGAIRDTEELRALGFPVFAAGACPNGPTKRTPGRINVPVSVGGCLVRPGDLVVGDGDGVVVLDPTGLERLCELAEKKMADEATRMDEIRRGEDLLPSWLEPSLVAAGVIDA